jgi:hypothetical protein
MLLVPRLIFTASDFLRIKRRGCLRIQVSTTYTAMRGSNQSSRTELKWGVLRELFITTTIYLREKIQRRKDFGSSFQSFQCMVGWLHCFWACGMTEHHGRKTQWRKAAHLIEARKHGVPARKRL